MNVITSETIKNLDNSEEYALSCQITKHHEQKEAFLKAIGKGITFGLDQFEVSIDLKQSYILDIQDPVYRNKTWTSQSFEHIPGYRLTLTKENAFGQLSVFG